MVALVVRNTWTVVRDADERPAVPSMPGADLHLPTGRCGVDGVVDEVRHDLANEQWIGFDSDLGRRLANGELDLLHSGACPGDTDCLRSKLIEVDGVGRIADLRRSPLSE